MKNTRKQEILITDTWRKLCVANAMTSHYKWYPAAEDAIVPWNARYSFPAQAAKAIKTTPRLQPKNGASFNPGQTIRLEFPAQGYINPRKTTLSFDVALTGYSGGTGNQCLRFQNNIQSCFQRVRLLYGSTPIEDIIDYGVITRSLTEWVGTNTNGISDQFALDNGIGGSQLITDPATSANNVLVNTRQAFIQGIDATATNPIGTVPNTACTRRYSVQLNLGLFNQDKLIPVKFMASQLAIEITLASETDCIFVVTAQTSPTTTPTYTISNIVLLPEILEFDAAYDAMFLKGLKEGGVPIKFQSWHTFSFNVGGQTNVNVLIQERSRSLKSLFAIQRKAVSALTEDNHATVFSSASGTLQNYQWRIGGRYYPASPVQTSLTIGGAVTNGASEALVELEKALGTLGDARLSTSITAARYGAYTADYNLDFVKSATSIVAGAVVTSAPRVNYGGSFGSQCFGIGVNLETTDGSEISGLNAEEQSDLVLNVQYSAAQTAGNILQVFAYYDAMLILKENNVLELVQ